MMIKKQQFGFLALAAIPVAALGGTGSYVPSAEAAAAQVQSQATQELPTARSASRVQGFLRKAVPAGAATFATAALMAAASKGGNAIAAAPAHGVSPVPAPVPAPAHGVSPVPAPAAKEFLVPSTSFVTPFQLGEQRVTEEVMGKLKVETADPPAPTSGALGQEFKKLDAEGISITKDVIDGARAVYELKDALLKKNIPDIISSANTIKEALATAQDVKAETTVILQSLEKILGDWVDFEKSDKGEFKFLIMSLIFLWGDWTGLRVDGKTLIKNWHNAELRKKGIQMEQNTALKFGGDTTLFFAELQKITYSLAALVAGKEAARTLVVQDHNLEDLGIPTPEGLEMRKSYAELVKAVSDIVEDSVDAIGGFKFTALHYPTELFALIEAMPDADKDLKHFLEHPIVSLTKVIEDVKLLPTEQQQSPEVKAMVKLLQGIVTKMDAEQDAIEVSHKAEGDIKGEETKFLAGVGGAFSMSAVELAMHLGETLRQAQNLGQAGYLYASTGKEIWKNGTQSLLKKVSALADDNVDQLGDTITKSGDFFKQASIVHNWNGKPNETRTNAPAEEKVVQL